MIREFRDKIAPTRGVQVSLQGFREKYHIEDQSQFVDHTTRQLQDQLTPERVLGILQEGNERFRTGKRLTRDFGKELLSTSAAQHPMAVILSCIDSRSPADLFFDLGLGDKFFDRDAGIFIHFRAQHFRARFSVCIGLSNLWQENVGQENSSAIDHAASQNETIASTRNT